MPFHSLRKRRVVSLLSSEHKSAAALLREYEARWGRWHGGQVKTKGGAVRSIGGLLRNTRKVKIIKPKGGNTRLYCVEKEDIVS